STHPGYIFDLSIIRLDRRINVNPHRAGEV
ncbi:unnamed protein product, partial [Allacma fusca]